MALRLILPASIWDFNTGATLVTNHQMGLSLLAVVEKITYSGGFAGSMITESFVGSSVTR